MFVTISEDVLSKTRDLCISSVVFPYRGKVPTQKLQVCSSRSFVVRENELFDMNVTVNPQASC